MKSYLTIWQYRLNHLRQEDATVNEKTGRPKPACTYIDATIFVDRSGQKAIVIGEKGAKLKNIGMDARVGHGKNVWAKNHANALG